MNLQIRNTKYPFGMLIESRKHLAFGGDYAFGFNGKMVDKEVKGDGNSLDFGARIYDPRLGRWMSVDPLEKSYISLSPFHISLNNPIYFKDNDGNVVVDKNGNPVTISISEAENGTCSATYKFSEGTTQEIIDDFMINGANLIDELLTIGTGTSVVEKAINTSEKIHIVITPTSNIKTITDSEGNNKIGITEGETKKKSIYTNTKNGIKTNESKLKEVITEITVFEGSIKESQKRLSGNSVVKARTDNKLTDKQMTATVGLHELEHATNEIEQKNRNEGKDGANSERHEEIKKTEMQGINEYGAINKKQ